MQQTKEIPESIIDNIIKKLDEAIYEETGNPDIDIQILSIEKDEDDEYIRYYINFEVDASGYNGYESVDYYGIPSYYKVEYPSVHKKGYVILLHDLKSNNYIIEGIVYE